MRKRNLRLLTVACALIMASFSFADELEPTESNEFPENPPSITEALPVSSEDATKKFPLSIMPGDLKLSYDDINMPDGQDNLKLVGLNFLMQPNEWLYGGVGGFGSFSGDLGGLFILGVDVGVKHAISDRVGFDVGYFAGGGGKHSTNEDYSGFMTRASAELTYNLSFALIGAGYSYINYPGYDVHNGQYTLSLSLPLDMLYGSPGYSGQPVSALSQLSLPNDKWFAFYKTFVGLVQQNYFLQATDDTDSDVMRLVGVKAGIFATPHIYFYASADGAYESNQSGFVDVFGGMGWQMPLSQRFYGYIDGAVGSGGGGGTDTAGGFMYKPEAGLAYMIMPSLTLKAGGGYIKSSGDDFEGAIATLGIYYNFLSADAQYLAPPEQGNGTYRFAGWRLSVGSETYINPERDSGTEVEDIDVVTVSLDRMLDTHFYLTGQAASAYGGNAGSYASGMAGAGVETGTWKHMRFGADLLAGVAGGGAVAVGDGAVYQPEASVIVDLTDYLSLQGKVGNLAAFNGDLNTTTYSASLVMRFSSLEENF